MKTFILLIPFVALTTFMHAQIIAGTHVELTDAHNDAKDLKAADIDGDGILDLVVASKEANSHLVWYKVIGNGTLSPPNIIDTGGHPLDLDVGDLDNDGDMDVVIGQGFTIDKVVWYENDGNGNFSSSQTIGTVSYPHAISLAHMNGDDDLDIVVSSLSDDEIVWFDNTNAFLFTKRVIEDEFHDNMAHVTIDVDNDGDLDIATITNTPSTVSWFKNFGNDNINTETVIDDNDLTMTRILAHDVNEDGYDDLIIKKNTPSELILYRNNGNGSFQDYEILTSDINGTTGIFLPLDMDGDGDLDFFISAVIDFYWIENVGGTDNLGTIHEFSDAFSVALEAVALDFDSDNDLDIVYMNTNSGELNWFENIAMSSSNENHLWDGQVSISPNPSQDGFDIEIQGNRSDIGNIRVLDISGKTIFEANSETNIRIPSENWSSGIYYLSILNTDGMVIYRDKLMKL